jgi:hypothetical protein
MLTPQQHEPKTLKRKLPESQQKKELELPMQPERWQRLKRPVPELRKLMPQMQLITGPLRRCTTLRHAHKPKMLLAEAIWKLATLGKENKLRKLRRRQLSIVLTSLTLCVQLRKLKWPAPVIRNWRILLTPMPEQKKQQLPAQPKLPHMNWPTALTESVLLPRLTKRMPVGENPMLSLPPEPGNPRLPRRLLPEALPRTELG